MRSGSLALGASWSRAAWSRAGQQVRGKEEEQVLQAQVQLQVQVQLQQAAPALPLRAKSTPHHAPPHDAGPSQDNSHPHHQPAVRQLPGMVVGDRPLDFAQGGAGYVSAMFPARCSVDRLGPESCRRLQAAGCRRRRSTKKYQTSISLHRPTTKPGSADGADEWQMTKPPIQSEIRGPRPRDREGGSQR